MPAKPPPKGNSPLRPIRWPETDWATVQAALAKSGRSYAEVARELLLKWAKRTNSK